jgi:glycerol-3-phosphate dehydrogenase (NAD(P)+)
MTETPCDIAVLGAGAFGTALAIALSRPGCRVALWARDAEQVEHMARTRRAPRLPAAEIPPEIEVTGDMARASRAAILLLAVPMTALPKLLADPAPFDGRILVAACKGIDVETGLGPVGLVARHVPQAMPAILTGPSFAIDIARGLPTALTLACADPEAARRLQKALSRPALRLYRTTDMAGAELGGALKNVMALAAGIAIGAGLGDSARAATITRGFAEMRRLAKHRGARPGTLSGLSGLGDLILTATSETSRNFSAGLALGRGERPDPSRTVEGVATARAVARLAQSEGLDMPLTVTVARLIDGELTLERAVEMLLSRPLKKE